jgi:hypothetical protein
MEMVVVYQILGKLHRLVMENVKPAQQETRRQGSEQNCWQMLKVIPANSIFEVGVTGQIEGLAFSSDGEYGKKLLSYERYVLWLSFVHRYHDLLNCRLISKTRKVD